MNPIWGYPPAKQVTEVFQPSKFWTAEDENEKNLFEESKQEVKLFLMSKNEGVDVTKLLEMIQKYGTKGEVKFKEMGFNTFNEFLFHIDDVYELRTTGTVLYLFFKGEVDETQEHIRTFVQEQKKDPGATTRFMATKENTYAVPSHYLIQPPKPPSLLATPHHLLPNPHPFFQQHQQQQQHQFYYHSGFMQPQMYMGIASHQFQQSYNMTNFLQNPGLQYQLAYNQLRGQMMMNVFPNQQQQYQYDVMMRQRHALSQNGQHPLINHFSVPVQNPFLTIHPKTPCPIHSLNSPPPPTPAVKTTTASINNTNNDTNELDKENTDVINENPDTISKKCLIHSAVEETVSPKAKKPEKKRKISLREVVNQMLENEQNQTTKEQLELNDKPVSDLDDESSSSCSSSSSSSSSSFSSSSTLVPNSSSTIICPLNTTPNISSSSASLIPTVPDTENNYNDSSFSQNEAKIEDFKFATISPHSNVKETIKEKVTTRNFTSMQQALNELLRMEEEEEMRQEKDEKKDKIDSKNSTESGSLTIINPVENSNHSSVEVKENSDIQEQQQSNNVKIKSKEKQNCITIKQIQLVSCGWTSYRLLGVDAYAHFILKPSDPKINEYYDKEMEKMEEFYSSVDNQYQYHLNLDDMKIGMFVVIRIPVVQQNHVNMKSRRYARAKIFSMEDQDKTGFISCLGVDDFVEYLVHFNDIFRLKVEFSRPTARAITTILKGTEGCFLLPDIAKAFRKCQSQLRTRIHPIVKVQVLQEKHHLLQSPVVKIETDDERDLFQILLDINPSITKQPFDEAVCKFSLQSLNTYQKQVFTELVRRGYIGNSSPIN